VGYTGSYMWRLRRRIGHELLVMPSAQVLLIDEIDRLYLQRRRDLGTWEMPAGTCEPGSSFAQTAVREVAEETGLRIEIADLVAFASLSDPAIHTITYPNGDRTQCFSVCFYARKWTGSISIEAAEVLESSFFDPDHLPSPLHSSTRVALDLYGRFVDSKMFQIR
jgi:8-oxo-dGTP pyrophosphatase MutT (NUDIX family)